MARSIIGKYVHIKDSSEHCYAGHHGWVVSENIDDDEFLVGGGSISILGSGIEPSFCRTDLVVRRNQPDNQEYIDYLEAKNNA